MHPEFLFKKDDALMAMGARVPLAKLDDTLSLGLNELPICPEGVGQDRSWDSLPISMAGAASQPTFAITARAPLPTSGMLRGVWMRQQQRHTPPVDLDVAFRRAIGSFHVRIPILQSSPVTLVGKAMPEGMGDLRQPPHQARWWVQTVWAPC
ncbi:MAG: hypothetical protein IPH49_14775 [Ignavibacteria bacterium]|nr:hypothetical protein [Ignavibacteria bacterium]